MGCVCVLWQVLLNYPNFSAVMGTFFKKNHLVSENHYFYSSYLSFQLFLYGLSFIFGFFCNSPNQYTTLILTSKTRSQKSIIQKILIFFFFIWFHNHKVNFKTFLRVNFFFLVRIFHVLTFLENHQVQEIQYLNNVNQ